MENKNNKNEKKTKKPNVKKKVNKTKKIATKGLVITEKDVKTVKKNTINTKREKISQETLKNNVDHPKHYIDNFSGIEVIESNCDLTNCLANVFKYCMRAGKKDAILQELHKARFYCDYYINGVKNGKITPQHKVTKETFNNIQITSRKAIDSFNDARNTTFEREWEIKSTLYAHFYLSIEALQDIAWWKFNKKFATFEHMMHIDFVKKYIDELIEYYSTNEE